MNTMEQLTRAERLQRIGELLSKGVTLMLTREKQADDLRTREVMDKPQQNQELPRQGLEPDETAILSFLRQVGPASPRDIQKRLNISKATAFRKLTQLVQAGLVVRSGNTTAIRYQPTKSGTG